MNSSDVPLDTNVYISLNEAAGILSRAVEAPVSTDFIEALMYDGQLQSGRLYRSAWFFRADEVNQVADQLRGVDDAH